MERLSEKLAWAIEECVDSWSEVQEMAIMGAIKRLAAYEDTGLTPEQVDDMAKNIETRMLTWFEAKYGFPIGKLMDFCEAEQQGRLVVLPCKVGDTVYMENGDDETPHFVDTGKVFAIGVDESGTMWISVRYESGLKYYHTATDIGKTVFLTREEAEAALSGGKNNDH